MNYFVELTFGNSISLPKRNIEYSGILKKPIEYCDIGTYGLSLDQVIAEFDAFFIA